MKLETVHFDAFKSLLNVELELTHSCMGMVGINESGKTNVLSAIRSLSDEHRLVSTARPKMANDDTDPHIRFTFALNDTEANSALEAIKAGLLVDSSSLMFPEKKTAYITYHVEYNIEDKEEYRYFTLDNLIIPDNCYALRHDAETTDCHIVNNEEHVSLDNAFVVSSNVFEVHISAEDISLQLESLKKERLSLIEKRVIDTAEEEGSTSDDATPDSDNTNTMSEESNDTNVCDTNGLTTESESARYDERLSAIDARIAELEV